MPSRVKQYTQYDENKMRQAVRAVQFGGWSKNKAAKTYNVPRTTLIDKLSGKSSLGVKAGRCTYLTRTEELAIVSWIKKCGRSGVPVRKSDVQSTVQKFLEENEERVTPFKNRRPGKGWMKAFMKRHPRISVRTPETVSKARASNTEESIREWFDHLKTNLEEMGALNVLEDPKRVFNTDETCVRLCPRSGRVIGERGWKNVYEVAVGPEKSTLTFLGTFNADRDIVAPMVIYPYKRVPGDIERMLPANFCHGRSDSGWMKSETFYEFISKGFIPWIEANNITLSVILFVDGHRTHMTMQVSTLCENAGIILYLLPPNTTHILQPADVGAFKPLKHYWQLAVGDFQRSNVNAVVTRKEVAPILGEVLKKISRSTVRNAFRACGLCPLNPDAVDYSKCLEPINDSDDELEDGAPETRAPVNPVNLCQQLEALIGKEKFHKIAQGEEVMQPEEIRAVFSSIIADATETTRLDEDNKYISALGTCFYCYACICVSVLNLKFYQSCFRNTDTADEQNVADSSSDEESDEETVDTTMSVNRCSSSRQPQLNLLSAAPDLQRYSILFCSSH